MFGIHQQFSFQSHFRWLLLIINYFRNSKFFPLIQQQPLNLFLNCWHWAAPGNQKLTCGIWPLLDPIVDQTLSAFYGLGIILYFFFFFFILYFFCWKRVNSRELEIFESHNAKRFLLHLAYISSRAKKQREKLPYKTEKQTIEWKKIFTSDTADKGIISKIHIQLI